MLPIGLHKHFIKDFARLDTKVRKAFMRRRDLFLVDRFSPLLKTHPLSGEFTGCYSFNVTGDIRVIYVMHENATYTFLRIGTHSELYG